MTESLGEFNTEQLDRARARSVSGIATDYIDDLVQENDDLWAENERLTQWVNDLQADSYVTCVYCGHNYGPDDEVPTSMAEVLKEHIENCPKHPMSALKKELEHWKQAAQENLDGAANIAGIVDEMYELQPCGHERRFIVTGKDSDIDPKGESGRGKTSYCALCQLESIVNKNKELEKSLAELADECGAY